MTLKLEQRKQALFHIMAWLILIFIISNAVIIETGELSLNVFYRVTFGMAIFYLNYSFLVPRLLLNNHKLAYFFCVLLTVVSSLLIRPLFPNYTPIASANKIGALVFFPIINIVLGTAIRIYQQWSIDEKNKKKIEEQKNLTELQVLIMVLEFLQG
jgi:two-component system LytT family sensor kinase